MSPLVRLAKKMHMTGVKLIIAYALLILTASFVVGVIHAAKAVG